MNTALVFTVLYTVSPKTCHIYLSNNSVKHFPILIIFDRTQRHEET